MNYPLYNDKLSPIWNINEDGALLDPEVRKQLLKIAIDFVKDLKSNNDIKIKIEDVVLIGSLTNYNWTPYSDVDLHIIADYGDLDMSKEDAQTMFDAIKAGWNNKHNITMKGHDVELYVQDIDYKPTSASEYSVLRNEWIAEPKKESPNFNKSLIKKKYKEYKNKIDKLTQGDTEKPLKDLLDKLYKFRQAGLDSDGELSEENIVFKMLRAKGYLDKLKDNISSIYDDKMSVDESKKITTSDIHNLADKKGIKWDNEPSFLKLTKQLTGKEHLDDLDQSGLKRIKDFLENIKDNISSIYDDKMSVDEGSFSNMFGSPDTIKYEVRSYDDGRKYTATKDGKQIGSATVENSNDGNSVLLDIWVKSSHRNLGIGKKLMDMILKKEKKPIKLEPSDQMTKDWYTRLGFVPTGEGNWMELKEIAFNYPQDDEEYQQGLEIVAQAILKAAKQYGEFPDINPLLEKLSSMFDKNVDEVHTDLARVYSKMSK